MTTRLLIGDVFDRMAELPDHSFDLIVTSPPFLALRSYLPDGHPDKAKEIGSEPTPADYLDTLLALTAEWRRLLAAHGSIAIELGDTYAGSGGAGGDYNPDGLRAGQPKFRQGGLATYSDARGNPDGMRDQTFSGANTRTGGGNGWPLDKSLTGIPTLYAWSLAYGRNLLTGQPSPAGQWRVRNVKPWIRSNPPVGALGDKERPATSYITVACTGSSRWFDLDAVRTPSGAAHSPNSVSPITGARGDDGKRFTSGNDPGGAPPLDWWHHVDAIIDAEIDARRAGKPNGSHTHRKRREPGQGGGWATLDDVTENVTQGARGVHIRRALEKAGILPRGDFYDVSPRGYAGSHYAVFPMELVNLMISEMCPMRVCRECGEPSRRLTETTNALGVAAGRRSWREGGTDGVGAGHVGEITVKVSSAPTAERVTTGWSDCGHSNWRPGRICDPFVGSGTTLAVASGMGRDSVGIDLDERNAHLCAERVGMFLEIDHPDREVPA